MADKLKEKQKVLIIDNSPQMTGALRSILSVTGYLKDEFDFLFITPTNASLDIIHASGFEVKRFNLVEIQKNWRLFIYIPMLILNSFRIVKLVRQRKINLIHVNDIYNMIGVIIKLFYPKIKIVYHVRLLPSSYVSSLYSFWNKLINHYSDVIICVSNIVASKTLPSNKKVVIYDAISLPGDSPKIRNTNFNFLYLGNYIHGKGQSLAIESFHLIYEKMPNAKLIFIGSTLGKKSNQMYKSDLKNMIQKYKLEDQVYLYDYLENIEDAFRIADISLNFSTSESFSMVCLESLAYGVPTIASKSGGPEEIIMHGENGFLVENGNINEIAHAMLTLYNDEELIEKMRKNSVSSIGKFAINHSGEQLKKVYQSLI